jgi:putative phosphoserine phosphatase/1-acylglycerol-3-phosphate O-acyltransferase
VSGAEHLWSVRRCVLVFNHQSKLDPILIVKLLRGGFAGVAKKDAANGGCRKLGSAVTLVFAGRRV